MDNTGRFKAIGKLLFNDPVSFMRKVQGRRRDPLFVFQMGKVASRTVSNTLESKYYVRHCHISRVFNEQIKKFGHEPDGFKGAPISVISIVRDPVGCEISSFFQNINNTGHKYCVGTREEVESMPFEELTKFFVDGARKNIGYILNWFDIQFKEPIGVDIYEHPFDIERGWDRISGQRYNVWLMRFEDINRNFVDALNDMLSSRREGPFSITELRSKNVSNAKWYAGLMKRFKEEVRFDPDHLREVYDSRHCRHFYSEEERAAFLKKWLRE